MAGRALRFRRLISFLRHRRLYATARALGTETRVFFDAAHLCRMIRHDRWAAASSYVLRFLNLRDCTREAGMLHRYIVVFRVIADLAAGPPSPSPPPSTPYSNNSTIPSSRNPTATLPVGSASRLYHNTKPNAVDAVMNLVANCPELKPKLAARLPHCTFYPTISLGPRLRGCTTHHKNKHGRMPAYAIAASFLRKRSPLISPKADYSALCPFVMDQSATSSSRSARKASSDREPVVEVVSELVEVDEGVQHRKTLESESADQPRSKRVSRPNPNISLG
ncbi:hypothetical protein U9M48_041587 [Paspalum notatum var. saurae]|uniref:Uncharacterized protein n=1 Tax=Paspalum notatum var. saurae TaxID=547442 RepID=A0AAQ3UP32_PASNO